MGAVRYLLDTSILSHLIRFPRGNAAERIRGVGESAVATSVVVACELRYGVRKKGSPALTERVDALLDAIDVLPLGPGVDVEYGRIRNHLEARGTPIGANDLLIAAHALAEGLTLVTDNVEEFSRVPDLRIENWLRTLGRWDVRTVGR
ncbi:MULTISPECIES: type II toxin-antitoxin system VapC family toxin [Deferrisoma]